MFVGTPLSYVNATCTTAGLTNVQRTCAVSDVSGNVKVASSVVAVFFPIAAVLTERAVPKVNVVWACRRRTSPVDFSMTENE